MQWILRFVRFHGMRSRADLFPAEAKIEGFLTDLALQGNAAVVRNKVCKGDEKREAVEGSQSDIKRLAENLNHERSIYRNAES